MSGCAQWQMDGSAAQLYERYPARYILGPWSEGLLDAAGVRAGHRVLDLACGTGVVATAAAARVGMAGHVTGLDLNPGMLAVARAQRAPGASVRWVERSALDTGLPDRSFDIVVCQQGFQFFPDRSAALHEMRRVLAPGGGLAMSVWRSVGLYNSAVGNALAEHLGPAAARAFCASRDVPSGEELVRLATAAGLRNVELQVQSRVVRLPAIADFVIGHLAGTPIALQVRALSDAARAALGRDVARRLAPYAEGDGVAFPEDINVVIANA